MPKKPTLKKKSGSSSRVPTTTEVPKHVRIFDVNGGKIATSNYRKNHEGDFELQYPALLAFKAHPLEGGRKFRIDAEMTGIVGIPALYTLFRSAIRGVADNKDPWLVALYDDFVTRAKTGEFYLNPYAVPQSTPLLQGTNGAAEGAVSEGVAVIDSAKPPETASG